VLFWVIVVAVIVAVLGLLWLLAGREDPALVGRRDKHQRAVIDAGAGDKKPPFISI
jgi:hypothetical protein